MAYIPKSKVNILETSGNEFIIKSTGDYHIGKYLELSNGKYYAGSDPTNITEELIIPFSSERLSNSLSSTTYSNLKPKVAKFLSSVKPIYPFKNKPTEEDYKRNYYIRYFAKKINEPRSYIEIDINIYNSISQSKKEYDFRLYEVGFITWNLKNGTTVSNFKNIQIFFIC